MSTRVSQLVLASTLFVLILLISLNIFSLLSQKPFVVPGRATPGQLSMTSLLDAMAPDGKLQAGAETPIAALTKNDGDVLNLFVAEGTFQDSTIQPQPIWSKILDKPSVIVSSADEVLRNTGGISKSIGSGCTIKQLDSLLPTGTTNFDHCEGSYKQEFPNIAYVASAIIVAWKGVSETPNCRLDPTTTIDPDQPGYTQCITNAIENALSGLFNRQEMVGIDTVVLPALGTGTGNVSKGDFYKSMYKALERCLQLSGCSEKLPRIIVLVVWSGETGLGAWTDTRDAIARNMTILGQNWMSHYVPNQQIQKRARFLGVLLVILVFVIAYSYRESLPAQISHRLPTFGDASLWIVTFGWFLVAAGAFSVLSDFADVPVSMNRPDAIGALFVNIVFGSVAAVICSFMKKATTLFAGG
jgi:hypothetical protein